jgi:hypothetical protein
VIKNLQLLPALLALGSLSALSQSTSFTIAQHGHQVGTANFSTPVTSGGRGFWSQVNISMQGLTYLLSNDELLFPSSHLRHAQISATVNGAAVKLTVVNLAAVNLTAAGSDQYLLNISANGRTTSTRLEFHPAAVLLPDFDPGALQTLLDLSASPTDSRSGLWAILPKQSTADDGSTQPASIQPIQLATYRDEQGTLDGKPIAVHHLIATIAGAQTELFSGPDNQLLQAELPQQGFALVRDRFILTPPTRPIAPPGE